MQVYDENESGSEDYPATSGSFEFELQNKNKKSRTV